MASLQLEHVRKAYPNGFVAVEDATFDVADGERLVLVGPSGCGKSTLLRMIARPAHRTRRLRCAGRLARPAGHRRHPAGRRVAGQGASGFDAEVEVVEPVGSDVFVNLRLGSQALVARFGPETHPTIGARLTLLVLPQALHVFDRESGLRRALPA